MSHPVFMILSLVTHKDNMKNGIKVKCHSSHKITNQQGYLAHYGNDAWYCLDDIKIILILSGLCQCFSLSPDSNNVQFKVKLPMGVSFQKAEGGYFHYNITVEGALTSTQLFKKVDNRWKIPTEMPTMEGFSKKEIKAARATCQLQDMLGHPSDTDFANMENFNFIKIVQSLYMSSTIPLTSSTMTSHSPGARLQGSTLRLWW